MILFCLQGSNFCHQLFFYMHQYELKLKWMNIMQFALTLLNMKSYKINVIQVLKTDYIKRSLCVKKLITAIFFF